ncbi:MAG: AAA family ATPase [Planctomycetaceae bacterium]|nr:AAA family ATPase [Planctomycetaceae bacterium]
MFFSVLPQRRIVPTSSPSQAFLRIDDWNDWFEFTTLFTLFFVDANGELHNIGGVKIGSFNMPTDQQRPPVPDTFEELDDSFFSLGQDDSYYDDLNKLGSEVRNQILTGLRDVAADEDLFQRALGERVMKVSLLRSVTPLAVQRQFRRLAQGDARLSRFTFTYNAPKSKESELPPISLSFDVKPESNPPTNIHVLIGRNGVGKTHLLNLMTRALLDGNASARQVGAFVPDEADADTGLFANLVSVTFSAFDPFQPLPEQKDRTLGIQYAYIGLKRSTDTGPGIGTPKSPAILQREFAKSVRSCVKGARGTRWRRALEMLEADPIFKDAEVASLADAVNDEEPDAVDDDEFEKKASSLFGKLSSGHKIVLLTITRLVETVEERTLVLLDEPEAHLHPPLLSAFIRSLSDLLIDRNGVAIIATHSPVVLQEVPSSCAWKLRRTGTAVSAERPETETFGENVGVLTREVFGLEVTHSGFHKLLFSAVQERGDYELVLRRFHGTLGAEARAIVRALIATRDNEKDD